MEIEILQLVEGAKQAKGLTVVIDVFRAFSLEPYLFSRGVSKIIPVGSIETAYEIKRNNPDYLLFGERNERMPEGFDMGNSPHLSKSIDVEGKTIIHTTSAGTQGIVNAIHADEIITGSFVNINAIIKYIRERSPQKVSLCCMGYASQRPSEEDTLCAEYIKSALENRNPTFNELVQIMRNTSGKRFFIPANQHFAPEQDFYLCTQLSIFDFVLKVQAINGEHVVTKHVIS